MFGAEIQNPITTKFVTDLSPSNGEKQPTFVAERGDEAKDQDAEKKRPKEELTVSLLVLFLRDSTIR
jgi:hypothetical protein